MVIETDKYVIDYEKLESAIIGYIKTNVKGNPRSVLSGWIANAKCKLGNVTDEAILRFVANANTNVDVTDFFQSKKEMRERRRARGVAMTYLLTWYGTRCNLGNVTDGGEHWIVPVHVFPRDVLYDKDGNEAYTKTLHLEDFTTIKVDKKTRKVIDPESLDSLIKRVRDAVGQSGDVTCPCCKGTGIMHRK